MIEIKTTEQFNSAVKAFKAENQRALTNCFMMPAEIEALTSEGRLFLKEYKQWLLILCDREDYSNLYYYTTEESDIESVKDFIKQCGDREIYLDIVSRSGRGDSHTPERLIKYGVAEGYKSYQRMQLPVKNIHISDSDINIADGYKISAEFCDSDRLTALWKSALDEKSTPLPKADELLKLREDGCLFSALNIEDDLAAVLMIAVTAKQGLIQHLAVSDNHRRKGLARTLMYKIFLAAKEKELSMLRLWVDCNNMPAIALYDSLGFQKDGMICDQLYMKGN